MRNALLVGGLVLVVRLLTIPRTPWDAAELQFPFAAMVAVSVVASVATAVALALAYGPLTSLLFSCSAAVLVYAGTARLEVVAWMFLALALLSLKKPAWLIGALAGAAAACHPPMLISALVLPLLVKERRWLALIAFAVVAVPFVAIPENLSGGDGVSVLRFTLHPWGSKFVALPVLACAAYGARTLLREWKPEHEVLMWFTVVHVATGIAAVSPSEGVRWAVPSLIFAAVLAARAGRIAVAALVGLSMWYAYPILRDRVTRPSPPVEAVRAIPRDSIILSDREMAPWVGGTPLDQGLRDHVNDREPLLLVASANLRGARVFSRPDADPYGKLTRNAYRRVSLLPIEHRYAPLFGVHGLEHDEQGGTWRWLNREAEIGLPRGIRIVRLMFRSPSGPNEVLVNGRRVPLDTMVELPAAERMRVRAAREYDLELPDTRRVAVQLVRLEYQ
jgi:hypothetical protein